MRIERAQRLIQQQQRGLTDQRLRQSHQLFLAAGQLIEVAQRQVSDAQLLQQGHHFRFAAGVAAAARGALRHDDRLQHVQMHPGGQRLRQIDHFLRPTGERHLHQIAVVQPQLALRRVQPGQRAQQRRFSAAVRPQQHGDLPARQHRHREIVDHRALRVARREVFYS